jgi:hypothetical protein
VLTPARSLEDFDGSWVRAERESDDAAREQALLEATEAMSFVLRGPTRLYMRRAMVPADRYVFEVDGRRLSIDRQPGEKTAVDLDAPVEGATITFEQGVLRRDWTFDESTRGTTTWTLSEDGSRLAVRRRIRNAMLGGPAVYTTHYVCER